MKHTYRMKQGGQLALLMFALLLCTAQCKDKVEEKAVYNPSLPIKVDKFTPDSGGAATQLLIYGSNFGDNTEQIQVLVNGKSAPVVGSSGAVIYAIVPRQVQSEEGKCPVTLRIGEQETSVGEFHYTPHYIVTTLVGYDVEDGYEAIEDGPFTKAQFREPYWMAFDKDKNIYLIEENHGLRYIDLKNQEVTTKFRTGNGVNRPRTIAFTPGLDTMIIAHDASNWTDIGQIMLTKKNDNFTRWEAVCHSKQCNGGAFHPVNTNEYYFNSYEASQVYKARRIDTVEWKYDQLFVYDDKEWEFNIQFAPSGNFAYLVSINKHYVGRAPYNWQTRKLEKPQSFIGGKSQAGYAEGAGESARFNKPHQGVFDEDDNFYLCDALNHCIRKITPDGIVTTFAGRPGGFGNVDGELREAQFDRPQGIAYDKENKVFYIADQRNRCIRTISFE
jgi:DNA-binding beta-propeller fold protein YncE